MENIDIYVWAGIIVISLILEFTSMDLTSIWFSLGALVALILASLTVPLEWQVISFFVVSIVSIATLRQWAKAKLLNSEGKTNMELIKDEKFNLQVEITDTQKGALRYHDVVWTAISHDGNPIAEGEWVSVQEIKGNKLIVKKVGK